MSRLSEQRKRRFAFYFIFTLVAIIASFYGGIKLGRQLEKNDWLEIINKPECPCEKS